MRVRKIAKQLKRFYESYKGLDKENEMGIYSYHLACFDDKVRYIIRMSRKHYFRLAKKYPPNSMMSKLYIHKACSPYIFDDILEFWKIDTDRC